MQPVLVINDSPEFLSLMQDFLADEGYRVAVHQSASGVLERVTEVRPALIVLDLVLGTVDGWVVLAQLRADDVARDIPVILCTAAVDRARYHEEALAELGARVLEKPFDLDHMLALIVELTGQPDQPALAYDADAEPTRSRPLDPV